jgi:hypothetical protein
VKCLAGFDFVQPCAAFGGTRDMPAGAVCGGDYGRKVGLLRRFQSAVRRRDVVAIRGLVRFPLYWSGKVIAGEPAFRSRFEEILSVHGVKVIEAPDPAGLFCNWHGFMMGDGVVWGSVDTEGGYFVQAMNAEGRRTLTCLRPNSWGARSRHCHCGRLGAWRRGVSVNRCECRESRFRARARPGDGSAGRARCPA